MGRRGRDIAQEDMIVTYPVRGEAAGPVTLGIPGRPCTPEEVSAEILRKLRRDAEAALGEPVTRGAITVPAYFNDAQRNATKRAGELAGFTVERILNEPTAAALAYGIERLDTKQTVFVFDLGGGTFDVTIMRIEDRHLRMIATNGDHRLGGKDWDDIIVKPKPSQACGPF